jgi:hypothetical protein
MPASLPEATLVQNQANPSQGRTVIFDALSGPKASPFDARLITGWTYSGLTANGMPTYANDPTNCSTGALSTGIGFGSPPIFNPGVGSAPLKFQSYNFTDDYVPGQDLPSSSQAVGSILNYIGGGRSNADGTPNVYAVGMVGLCMAGNGGSRDGGTTPFTGFPIKTVTATAATVANGADIEAGFANRSNVIVLQTQSAFGSSAAALTDVS